MNKTILSKEVANHLYHPSKEERLRSRDDEILHLKRLLVTLKQQYESKLQLLNAQQQVEVSQRETLQSQLDQERLEWQEHHKQYQEELEALKQQQIILIDRLKKTQEELKEVISSSHSQEKVNALYQQIEEQEAQSQHLRQEQERHLAEQGLQLVECMQEREILHKECEQFNHLLEESEQRFKTAQHHLAKKVKEVALLNEKIEQQQTLFMERQHELQLAYEKIDQMQEQTGVAQKEIKQLKEQLQESVETAEGEVAQWYAKWQENEARIQALKKMEEKYYQMQNFLANLGTFMNDASLSGVETKEEKSSVASEVYDLFGMK